MTTTDLFDRIIRGGLRRRAIGIAPVGYYYGYFAAEAETV